MGKIKFSSCFTFFSVLFVSYLWSLLFTIFPLDLYGYLFTLWERTHFFCVFILSYNVLNACWPYFFFEEQMVVKWQNKIFYIFQLVQYGQLRLHALDLTVCYTHSLTDHLLLCLPMLWFHLCCGLKLYHNACEVPWFRIMHFDVL